MPAADFMILWCIFVVHVLLKIHGAYSQTDIGRRRVESTRVLSRLRFGDTCSDLPFYLCSNLLTMHVSKNDQPTYADDVIQKLYRARRHHLTSNIGVCYGIA